jgi:hypothetical protein
MKSFDSFDEMMAFMQEQERIANEHVTPEQSEIGYGDYWVRMYEGDLLIFGYIPTLEESEAQERELGADDEEIEFEQAQLKDSHSRGYRYGQCFSVIEPTGEWGSTHIANMVKITKDQFEFAKANGWNVVVKEA